ncbi:hypothetical protein [Corallococcus sp. CA054B]|uniref:hypothetical protein n=1 Tax=Corallococcus sp. CA054B TaxID=2316734 RepID=UPI0011C39198|nr:hypothetical protein [Corallococcus sp. CA054B]
MYAHWHYYPVSFDNANPTSNDYYERAYIAVNGESGSDVNNGAVWTRAKTIVDAASQAGGFDIIPMACSIPGTTSTNTTTSGLYYNHRIHNSSLVPTTQTSANLASARAVLAPSAPASAGLISTSAHSPEGRHPRLRGDLKQGILK